jgi:uncharacterized protein involved in outer membrane biogenesis
MMDLLDVDGLNGNLLITTSKLAELMAMMGIKQPSSLPLRITGPVLREGNHWGWHDTVDQLADNDLKGSLSLDEGARAQPDTIDLNLSAGKFNLKSVWNGLSAGPKMQADTFQDLTSLFLKLNLSAAEFLYGSIHVFHPSAQLTVQPGDIALQPSTFLFFGGDALVSGHINASNHNLQFSGQANVAHGNLAQLAKSLGANNVIAGAFDMALNLTMSGPILDQALQKNSAGGMVFLAHGGWIKKSLIEKISTDLRVLFNHDQSNVPLDCMIGIMDLHDGIGKMTPMRLKTNKVMIMGDGEINLAQQRLNMIVQSDKASSGSFALDIPISVSGPFSNLAIAPALSASVSGMKPDNLLIPTDLSASLKQLVQRTNCLQPQRVESF